MNKAFTFLEDGKFYEDPQTTKLRFALCNKNGQIYAQIHPFVKCRDFLGDVLFAIKENKIINIYNFYFDGSSLRIKDKNLFLLLESTKEELENIKNNLNIITDMEDFLNVKHTKIENTSVPNIYLVTFSDFWKKCNLFFSLYTFLFRCCCYKFSSEKWVDELSLLQAKEAKYLNTELTIPWFLHFISVLPEIKLDNLNFSGFSSEIENEEKIHHSSGFISMIKNIRIGFLVGLYHNNYGLQLVKLFQGVK